MSVARCSWAADTTAFVYRLYRPTSDALRCRSTDFRNAFTACAGLNADGFVLLAKNTYSAAAYQFGRVTPQYRPSAVLWVFHE